MCFYINKLLNFLDKLESKALALVLVSLTKAKALDSKEKITKLVCQCVSPNIIHKIFYCSSGEIIMSYLQRIRYCHQAKMGRYIPFYIEQTRLGWITPSFVEALKGRLDIFQIEDTKVVLNPALNSYDERTLAVAPVFRQLYEEGVIDTWVGEAYPVALNYEEPAYMEVERSAALYLGINKYGVHMNGLVMKNGIVYVWVPVRSRDRKFYPGKLDQMVAGGQPAGIGLMDNLVKEAAEEAAIPAEIARQAEYCGRLSYSMDTKRGLEHTTLYNFDLWLPEDFTPFNTDGEVESFERHCCINTKQ